MEKKLATEVAATPFVMKVDPFLDDVESDEEHNAAGDEESAPVSGCMKAPKELRPENYDQLTFDGNAAVVLILMARLPHVLLTRFKKLLKEEVMDITSKGLATWHHQTLREGIIKFEQKSENVVTHEFDASDEAFVDRIATSVLKHLAPPLFKMLGLQMKKNVCGEDDIAAEINANEESFGVMLAEMMLEDLLPYLDFLLKSLGWKV